HVADIMSEITAASQEQSSGIEQVNLAITQMDEMTQQNAALVEQAAAAAESMEEQAVALAQTVSVFKMAAGTGDHIARPVIARAERIEPKTVPKITPIASHKTVPAKLTAAPQKIAQANARQDEWEEF
ncbi:MAG TPA: methyl-accepting chemotaxis protein, partial [Undibacterium sp.]|nr:methyl-accepting chemotaxis protein [Undibacterium sp.]